jgi:phenylacetate-CoA ligase
VSSRDTSLYDAAAEAPSDWADAQDALARDVVRHAADRVPEVRGRLERAGVSAEEISGVQDLTSIPVRPKDDVPDLQAADPPFGGMLAVSVSELTRIYVSPGPILDSEGPGSDFWRMAPAVWAAGFRPGDVVLNTFAYHLTPGGMMLDSGLREVGCVVVPGGVGNSSGQIEVSLATHAVGYTGTPQFLLSLLERASESGTPLGLERALVTGAPFPPSLREAIESNYGIDAYECYGTADAGLLGYQCAAKEGWHVAPGVVIEILDPATEEPTTGGEAGQVVVTKPSPVYPLVRFGTGDLSALLDAPCGCGRKTPRLAGFLGRVGEGVKVRGMFVHPRTLDRALAPVDSVQRYQARVSERDHRDELVVWIATRPGASPDVDGLRVTLEEAVKLRLDVEIVDPSTIPEDAPRVVDLRGPPVDLRSSD